MWNPLKGQFRYTGLKNCQNVLSNSLFWFSMKNTALFFRLLPLEPG